jgi:REP element-mobilizing transposase RayT
MLELTARTIGAHFLLRPSEAFNQRVLAVIGRALHLYAIQLHAFAVLSNHWHCLFTPPDAATAREFVRYVQGNLARAVNDELGREGPVWCRAAVIPVVDAEAQLERLHYVLSQGAKEGLVATPLDWPGVHAARALCGREDLVGAWVDRSRAYRLRRGGSRGGGRDPQPHEVTTSYPITLAPVPALRHLEPAAYQQYMRALVATIEVDARAAHPRPLGAAAILAQDAFDCPRRSKRGRAPRCHAADDISRNAFLDARRAFIDAHRTASRCLRARPSQPAHYPGHAFPAAAPCVAKATTVVAAIDAPHQSSRGQRLAPVLQRAVESAVR